MNDEQFLVLSGLLTEIRDALYVLVGSSIAEDSDECEHPEPNRVSLATPSLPDHWICNVCRYEHGAVRHN